MADDLQTRVATALCARYAKGDRCNVCLKLRTTDGCGDPEFARIQFGDAASKVIRIVDDERTKDAETTGSGGRPPAD